jgi:hypothetical protein
MNPLFIIPEVKQVLIEDQSKGSRTIIIETAQGDFVLIVKSDKRIAIRRRREP